MKRRILGFTLIEMLVVISIIALLIGILLPSLGTARKTARRMENNTRVRGIHQGMVAYANGNRDRMPGLAANGSVIAQGADATSTTGPTFGSGDGESVQGRYFIMLNRKLFSPEYILSPMDTAADRAKWEPGTSFSTKVSDTNYSYALLMIYKTSKMNTFKNHRHEEWSGGNTNAKALMVSDRNLSKGTGIPEPSSTGGYDEDKIAISIHSTPWQGSGAWNDGHASFLDNYVDVETRYGTVAEKANVADTGAKKGLGDDNLFEEALANGGDAMMVHCGWQVSKKGGSDGSGVTCP